MDLNDFFKKYKSDVFALNNWIKIKNKNFNLKDALIFIYENFNGNYSKMSDFINLLTSKKKIYGRGSNLYDNNSGEGLDLVYSNGVFSIVGYKETSNNVGYSDERNREIYSKSGKVKSNYIKSDELFHEVGYFLREMFPNDSNDVLYRKLNAVRNFSREHKISYLKTCNLIKNGSIKFSKFSTDLQYESVENSKNVIIKEYALNDLKKIYDKPTYFSFKTSIKEFLKDLLHNPVNAKPNSNLLAKNLSRGKLISILVKSEILYKDEKIIDKNENDEFIEPKMSIKFIVNTQNFDRKLKKIYIKLFEKNIPKKISEEEGGGANNCSSSGQFSQPLFSVQKRNIYKF